MRTKNRQINFRVTEKEYATLNKRCVASGMKMSNFLLYSALDKEIVIIDGLPNFYAEMRKIGVNLNQLTKLCNDGKITCPELDGVREEVNHIWQSLNSLTRKVV